MTMTEQDKRQHCIIYGLHDDTDWMVFDMDIFMGQQGPGEPEEYTPLALVSLREASLELVAEPGFPPDEYKLRSKKGIFNAQQVMCGDAGMSVAVMRFR